MMTAVILLIYAGLFVYFSWRGGLKQWLLGAVVLMLACLWFMSNVLPGLLYHHTVMALYLLPACLTLSSLFFFANQWQYHRATKVFYVEPGCPSYLVYLGVSGMALHLAWLLPVLFSSMRYPEGLSFYSLMALKQLYFLQPIYWVVLQWSLMLILHWAQKWYKTPLTIITRTQIQFSFLYGLLGVSVYVLSDLAKYLH